MVIYVKTLRRAIFYPPTSKIGRRCAIRMKFNEILNDAAAHVEHNIMNITTCSLEHHYDHWGELSPSGQTVFWQELDHLLERFDNKEIMLLPKKPQKNSGDRNQGSEQQYLMPQPNRM